MSWDSPAEQAYKLILIDKDNTYPSIKAAEVVGHERKTESRSANIRRRPSVDESLGGLVLLNWNNLLEKPILVNNYCINCALSGALLRKEPVMK